MRLHSAKVVGRTVREVFPDASPVTYAARQRAFRQGRPTTGNAWHFSWTTAAGSAREADFRYIYQPLRNPNGAVEGLVLIASEKPQRKRPTRRRGPARRLPGVPTRARKELRDGLHVGVQDA